MSFGVPVRNGIGIGLLASTSLSSRGGNGAALNLNFLSGTLDSRITFTRSTTATFTGSNGLIQTAAINEPRFDYDPVTLAAKGLLIEEQRVNLLTYSEQFDNAAWTKTNSTITANATTAPDGTTNADKVVENTATGAHDVRRTALAASALTTYTQSIFIKAGERTKGQLQMIGNSGGSTVTFDLSAGTATAVGAYGGWASASATITSFGNGWFRITNTATTNTGLTAITHAFLLADASGAGSYTGDGTSGFFVWGAQLEAGAFATSYIPTVASQVTRTADVATMTGTNFSSWYSQSAGTMFCNFDLVGATSGGAVSNIWVVDNGGTANATRLREGTIIAGADVTMLTGNVVQVDSSSFVTPVNTVLKAAFAWEATSSNLTANGTSFGNGGALTPPAPTQLVLTGGNKHLRTLQFYNTRLPNATLQALTETPGAYNADYLIVAGGASGGSNDTNMGTGGGGAGGLLSGTSSLTAATVYTITVGGGGAVQSGNGNGVNGSNSSALSVTATGGGAGSGVGSGNGVAGGSGGGGSGTFAFGTTSGGTGTSGQGNNGGGGQNSGVDADAQVGGGGGGASAVGSAGTGTSGGNGGAGTASSITGSSVIYAGGGGGGKRIAGTAGTGGTGGGGNGGADANGSAGTANRGGGGGGAGTGGGGVIRTGGAGGSGVIILSVPTARYTGTTTGSPTVTTSGANTILTFTSSGSYTA